MSERIDYPDPVNWPTSSSEDDCKIDQQKPVSKVERRREISRSALREDDIPAGRVQRKHGRVSHPRLFSRRHSILATSWTTIVHGSIHLSTCAHTLQWFDNRSSDQRDRRHWVHVLLFCKETVRLSPHHCRVLPLDPSKYISPETICGLQPDVSLL